MAAALLLLICAGALLHSAEAQDLYTQLSDIYKKGVDLAMVQLDSHAGVHHHFRFLRRVDSHESESGFGVKYIYHHFYLKPTMCPKGTTETDPQRCLFRNDRPLMDCAICYKTSEEQIESKPAPYIHCIQKPRLTKAMTSSRIDHCKKMIYNAGAPTLLASTTN
ncbi:hypothetical protein PAMA_008431 [Pampus argenteus]